MKTNCFWRRIFQFYLPLGLFSLIIGSCSSYQNSSYYDSDGIYNSAGYQKKEVASNNNPNSNKYQEYFHELNKDASKSDILTDVNSYSSQTVDSTANSTQGYDSGNPGWGSNPQNVSVNVYDNSWGWSYWNNYWYGSYWGWYNWYGPYWGWYWPYWGWYGYYGYGYYGYNNWCGGYYNNYYYAYPGGRRGNSNYSYTATVNSYTGNTRNSSSNSVLGTRGYYTPSTRSNYLSNNLSRSNYSATRSTISNSAPRATSRYLNNNPSFPRSNNNYNQNNTTPRDRVRNTYSPSRSYNPSPSSSGPSRSYNSGGGFGGGSGGGFGGGSGGGRSGGGGRR